MKKNLNILMPVNSLSYGLAAKNISIALNSIYDVAIVPIAYQPDESTFASQEEYLCMQQMLGRGVFFDKDAPCLKIYHQNKMDTFVGRGPHIGFPFFELDRFKRDELHHLSSLDHLIVASSWAKTVCQNAGLNNVSVAPLGVDTRIFNGNQADSSYSHTVFFNIGKWEYRKGHDILFAAFSEAFKDGDNALLLMLPHNFFLNESEINFWMEKYKNPKIRILGRLTSQAEVANIMKRCDCGVFPSRAEGWNLPALETLAVGKHLITTRYSAHTEFCNDENSLLINIDELEDAVDNKWFFGDGKWAKLGDSQFNQLVEHMRTVHELKKSGKLCPNMSGFKTAFDLSWVNTAIKISEIIDAL